jgi:U3 small nucleolar ribonucleoprotein component
MNEQDKNEQDESMRQIRDYLDRHVKHCPNCKEDGEVRAWFGLSGFNKDKYGLACYKCLRCAIEKTLTETVKEWNKSWIQ